MTGPEEPLEVAGGDEARRIVHEALIKAPLAAVWRAVTSRALLAEWLGANDLVAETGRGFSLELTDAAGEASIADGQVLEVVPERRLRFSLAERDDKGDAGDDAAEIRSTVQIELVETADGVRFRLVHDGFERVAVPVGGMVWAVARQRVLHIRRGRIRRASGPIAVQCGLRRLAWAA